MSTLQTTPPRTGGASTHALDALQAELAWASARIDRLAAEARPSGRRHRLDDAPKRPPLVDLKRREQAALEAFHDVRFRNGDVAGLDAVQAEFLLDDLERYALLLSTGICLQKSFGELLGDLDGGCPGCVTVETIFSFLELPLDARVTARAHFRPSATLFAQDLASLAMGRMFGSPEQLLEAVVSITGRGLELVLGSQALAEELEAFSKLEQPRATFDQVVLPSADKQRLLAVVDNQARLREIWTEWGVDDVVRYGRGTLMLFTGPPGTGKTSTAHAIADRLGKRVLNVDIPTFVGHAESMRFLPGLFREARLHDALLLFDECESLFESRRRGNALMTLLLTELERFEGVAVLATNLADQLDEALDRRILVRVDFPRPDAIARERIWNLHVPPRAVLAPDIDVSMLARRYDVAGGYIKNAMLNAIAAAVAEDVQAPTLRHEHLDRAARDQCRRPAAEEGMSRLTEAKATLTDVALPARARAQVEELVQAAAAGRTVFERWGVAAKQSGGRGTVGLFHGPPGTGKTLCAEAIAGELGRPLLRVTLPSVLSKWVGDAERSLAAAFSEAAASEAVILLDEVDALLMERGAARASRHDDSLVNTLLDLIDRHEGVVLLCTNRPAVLDAALDRRVGWSVTFTEPDDRARETIWRRLLTPEATGGAALDLRGLASRYTLTGGRIRNAVIRAAMRAARDGRVVTAVDLERAAAEETGEQIESSGSTVVADA